MQYLHCICGIYSGEHRRLGTFGDVDVARGRRPGVPDVALGPRFMGWGVNPPRRVSSHLNHHLAAADESWILALNTTVLSSPSFYISTL